MSGSAKRGTRWFLLVLIGGLFYTLYEFPMELFGYQSQEFVKVVSSWAMVYGFGLSHISLVLSVYFLHRWYGKGVHYLSKEFPVDAKSTKCIGAAGLAISAPNSVFFWCYFLTLAFLLPGAQNWIPKWLVRLLKHFFHSILLMGGFTICAAVACYCATIVPEGVSAIEAWAMFGAVTFPIYTLGLYVAHWRIWGLYYSIFFHLSGLSLAYSAYLGGYDHIFNYEISASVLHLSCLFGYLWLHYVQGAAQPTGRASFPVMLVLVIHLRLGNLRKLNGAADNDV